MSCTWLTAKVEPKDVSWMFDPVSNCLPEKPIADGVWFELHQKGTYLGWVCLKKDGIIEFGEPGA